MNYLSICSGIEAATVAWEPLGFNPVGFAEIEKFPSAVLSHHYPHVKNYGDFTKIERVSEPVNIIIGGTPCQSFSIAGLRKGLDDSRGNLTMEFVRLCDRIKPRWIVWENVPGVLSINGGKTFAEFFQALAECGYQCTYRVLDAQYFGVPQRRRRVFVVGYLGDWRPATAVLLESPGLSGNYPPSGKTGQEIAGTLSTSFGSRGTSIDGIGAHIPTICGTVTSKWAKGSGGPSGNDCQNLVCIGGQHPNAGVDIDLSPTLTSAMGGGGGHIPIISSGVRRLTPVECERLQGFPDNYTRIPWRNKQAEDCPDGPRYSAIGNSMAVPVMRWIGSRIIMVEALK